ncbi:DUF5376 family protein [Pasteurella multocida]|uniref:DUF5376 family protein n=1 Tax=Pasteurella multocida TaxID=747 RepID=UPI003BA2F87D
MKVKFGYYALNGDWDTYCKVYESDNKYDDSVVTDYIGTLDELNWIDNILQMLKNPSLDRGWIDAEPFEALIDHDQIKVGFYLLDDMEEEDIPDDVDERDTVPRFIPRKEFAYLLEKWLDFYQRPITDMNYQEIIDTKEAYL